MKYRMLFVSAMIYLIAGNLSAQQANHVVISEVYGGGGNSGATLKNDFIELYNPTTSPISINGWSVQYASATGSWSASNITPLTGTIAPHGFFLIQEAQGTGGSIKLPTPDAQGSIAMGASSGKVALVNSTTAITGKGDPSVIDFVGYGAANEFEGTTSGTSVLSNTKSAERKASSTSTNTTMESGGSEELAGNGYDSNNNNFDFIIRTPQPQNSSSPEEPALSGGDVTPPSVISMKVISSTQIEILFNEPVDSVSSSTTVNYTITKSIVVSQAQRDIANIKRMVLTVATMANDIYTLTIQSIKDTAGNTMTTPELFQFTVGVLTIAQARTAGAGVNVRVRGTFTVANEFASPSYMQDTTGGLAVYNTKFSTSVRLGDIWEVAGVLSNYYGLLEMNPLTDSVKISSGNPIPTPKLLHSSGLSETEESQLVRVNKVKFASSGTFATGVDSNYAAGDSYGPMTVYISKYSNVIGSQIPTDSVNIIGVVNEHNGVYSILPRTLADINIIDPPSSQTWLDINIARAKPDSTQMILRGIVTYVQPSKNASRTIFLQDFSGGIALYDSLTDALHVGDSIAVRGYTKQFSNLLEISYIDSLQIFAQGRPLPGPKIITIPQAIEAYESQLVKLFEVRFLETGIFDGGTSGNTYNLTDGANHLQVFIPFGSALVDKPIPAGLLDILGVLSQHSTVYQLIPRDTADLLGYPGPQISTQPALTSVSDISFTVNWKSFFRGSSNIYYGLTKNLGDSVVNSSLDSIHSVTVNGLRSGHIYYYKATSVNSVGTSASFVAPLVTTSPSSTGEMDVYFNYPIDDSYGLTPLANGSTDLLSKLLNRIHNAIRTIDMAVYSFDDFNISTNVANRIADSLISAKNRGVKIRFVFDNKSTTTPLAKLIAAGIPVVKRAVPGIDNGIMHNKFFIFDGKDSTSATTEWVITGSWNVTDDGTFKDAQNAVFIQDQSLALIYTLEFEEMFGSSTDTPNLSQASFGPTKQDNTPHFTTIAGKKIEVFFSPSDHTTSNIIRALSTADKNIFFGVLAFTRDDIAQTLIERKNASVIVRGLIDQQPNVLGTLKTAGVDALQAGHSVVTGLFHHKYAVVDPFNDESDPLVITGSHNWSTAAEQDNDENTLIIHSGIIARQYVQEFSKRYKESGGTGVIVGVEEVKGKVPEQFGLSQNYPNPFNPATSFQFQIPISGWVSIKVFDILGREVVTLLNEVRPAGVYKMTWNASTLPSGVYFYRLQAGNNSQVRKALLLK